MAPGAFLATEPLFRREETCIPTLEKHDLPQCVHLCRLIPAGTRVVPWPSWRATINVLLSDEIRNSKNRRGKTAISSYKFCEGNKQDNFKPPTAWGRSPCRRVLRAWLALSAVNQDLQKKYLQNLLFQVMMS